MMKKLGIILLSIAFLLFTLSLLPVKRASANTGPERCMLMAAEPWDEYYHGNKGGSSNNSGDSYTQPQNRKVIQRTSTISDQSGEVKKGKKIRNYPWYKNWIWKVGFYLRVFINK